MENESWLLLDENFYPILIEDECIEFKPILKDFVETYGKNKGKSIEVWLNKKMQEYLPQKSTEEIQTMVQDIILAIETNESKRASLEEAIKNGRSKESWFASTVQQAASAMSTQQATQYLNELDQALQTANESLYRTITTQAGNVSQNPSLDGFIAEQYHAQTFNLNAKAAGSTYRAKVLEPTGNGYAKNSVDIVVEDSAGKVVSRYQSKYCKDAKATEQAFERGDYRGQQKLVPDGQEGEIQKKVTTVIKAPDGVTSNPLTKSNAELMRDEAQSGNWNELNWNEYKVKDLATGIGKQAGVAALQGAAIGVGLDIAQKLWNGEEIDGEDLVETALTSGTDFGLKAAVAGATKVGIEKDIITVLPKGTPAGTLANIAHVAIENVKVAGKMLSGEVSTKEGIEKMEQTTVATIAGLATTGKGMTIGASIGAIFGPPGAAVGGFVGGAVGYMAGSKIGETVVKGAQIIREGVGTAIKAAAEGIREVGSAIVSGITDIFTGFLSLF